MVRCTEYTAKGTFHGYGNSMETAYENYLQNLVHLEQHLFETGYKEKPEPVSKINFWSELLNFFRR